MFIFMKATVTIFFSKVFFRELGTKIIDGPYVFLIHMGFI